SVVDVLVHEMHGAAGNLGAILERLLLRVESRKGRQQRRMDVENAVGKCAYEVRREQTHVSGKAYQVYLRALEFGNNLAFVLFARFALRSNDDRMQTALARRFNA